MAKARKSQPQQQSQPPAKLTRKQRFNAAVQRIMIDGTPKRQAEKQARAYLNLNP